MYKAMGMSVMLLIVSGCDIDEKYKDTSRAYYGDFDSNKVFSINLDNMKLETTTEGGAGAYGLEAVGNNLLISLTRKDTSIDIINAKTKKIVNTIELGYQPREVSTSPSGNYSVVSGRDIPAHTLFNAKSGQKIKTYNLNQSPTVITDFGGQNATGHPYFVNEEQYLVLDRVHKEIRLYHVRSGLQDTLKTESSTHHILRKGSNLFVALEGSGSSTKKVSPGVLKLNISNSKIILQKIAYLQNSQNAISTPNVNIEDMGIHHINFHYDGEHIYTGSNDGHVYVINSSNMSIVDFFKSGKGGGHTDFSPKRKIGMVSSHKSSFVTMVDVSNPRKNRIIKHINVSNDKDGSHVLQGHTQMLSDDENRFYGAATSDGNFFEINLNQKAVSKKLSLNGANLEQGFMYQSPEGGFANPEPKFSSNSLVIKNVKQQAVLTGKRAIIKRWREQKNQGWDIQIRNKVFFSLKNRRNNKCLSRTNRNRVKAVVCNNKSTEQMWFFTPISKNSNIVHIQNATNGECLKSFKNNYTGIKKCQNNKSFQWEIDSILNRN